MSKYKTAVIGEKNDVLGFVAIGFETYFVNDCAEAENVLKKLVKTEEYAVIFINEKTAAELGTAISKYRYLPTPAIIVLPGAEGSSGYGLSQIKQCVEKAIGADILFKEN